MLFSSKRGGFKLVLPLTILVALSALAGASASAAPAPRALATFTVDRSDSANPVNTYAWRVPKGIKRVRFEAFGATGAATYVPGGNGGKADATYSVTPGQVFQIVIGGAGSAYLSGPGEGGLNGGGDGLAGGGGGSDVRVCADAAFKLCSLSDRFVVAGGGGGAGDETCGAKGGHGGGLTGARGSPLNEGWAGLGGTQTEGGAASHPDYATPGAFGIGGNGYDGLGGGGGGGWYGGGGGGIAGACGGGGGGSGYISPPALSRSFTTGAWSGGDGKVSIYKAG